MPPDFAPRIPIDEAERPPVEPETHPGVLPVAADAAPPLDGVPTANPEEIVVDEELAAVVQGVFDRFGGIAHLRRIMRERYGRPHLDEPDYEELMSGMTNLRKAGRVVNITRAVFAEPGSPHAISYAERRRLRKIERNTERLARREAESNQRPRSTKQAELDLETMMRRELGSPRGKASRSTARGRRRSKV